MSVLWRVILVGLSAWVLSACGSYRGAQAPFYIYNQGVLNAEVGTAYQPRRPDPARDGRLAGRPAPMSRVGERVASARASSDAPAASPKQSRPVAAAAKKKAAPKSAAVATKAKAQPAVKKAAAKPAAKNANKGRFVPQHSANYLKAIYEANGVKLGSLKGDDAVATLFSEVKKQGQVYHATRPAVGDLVFFHNTYDRNGDGRNNDWYTHVGLVEAVDEDGTIYVLSWFEGQVQTFPINLEHPRLARDERDKKIWNTQLRQKGSDDPAFTQYLGGELFAGFGSLLGQRTEIVVIDSWAP